MTTWLDTVSDAIGHAMGGPDDDRSVLARMHSWTLAQIMLASKLQGRAGHLTGDLHAFFEPRFGRVTRCLRLSAGLAHELLQQPPTEAERLLFGQHCERFDFTLIDCPDGAVPLGADVEVRAFLVKVARVVRDYAVGGTANKALEDHFSIDVVVGRRRKTSFQHLSFRGGLFEAHVSSLVAGGGVFQEEMGVMELLARAGTDPAGLLPLVIGIACRTIAYAERFRDSGLVRALARRAPDDPASKNRDGSSFFEVDVLLPLAEAPAHGAG